MGSGGWDALRELLTLQDRMNSLFEDSRTRSRLDREPLRPGTWAPVVDIFEHQGQIVIKAELPEMKQEEIKVAVEDNHLTIHGERKAPDDLKPEQFLRRERTYGSFSRSFSLPEVIDVEQIRADYRDGVLTVVLPRQSEAKARRISVKVE